MTDLRGIVTELARATGFDLVAVTGVEDFEADRRAALERLQAGHMDGLPWYTESRVMVGTRPSELLPGARSIICLGLSYWAEEGRASDSSSPESTGPGDPAGKIARYARSRDYHKVMKRRMRELVRALDGELGVRVSARWYVDDGPMLDRAAANRAGIGWFGKNSNILTPQFGSWVFLGQIITDLEIEPDKPLRKSCGDCIRCINDCPTGAIVAPYVIDNELCISYQTIENRGPIPRELRSSMRDWVFGCDICQEVCPVNRKAQVSRAPIPQPVGSVNGESTDTVDIVALLEMSEVEFRQRFAGTPILRARHSGMQRNACVALGNIGSKEAVPALARALQNAAPLVRIHAAWALGRIGGSEALAALQTTAARDTDPEVQAEIRASLAELAGG